MAFLWGCTFALAAPEAQQVQEAQQDQEAFESAADKPFLVLRGLDKVTARTTEIKIEIGKEFRFGSLRITPQYCRTRAPIEPPETFAYLSIIDQPPGKQPKPIFKGWMLASSPALNPLEHPVYDVWVQACITASGEDFIGPDDQLPEL